MKRPLVALVVLGLIGSTLAGTGWAQGSHPQMVAGHGTAAPSFVSGMRDGAPRGPAGDAALRYLRANAARYHVAAGDLALMSVSRFAGTTTARFAQRYHGVPVFGAQYLVHFRGGGSARAVTAVNGDYRTGLDVSTTPRITERLARQIAVFSVRPSIVTRVERHGLTVLPRGTGALAWHFTMWGTRYGHPAKQQVLVGARTGNVLLSYSDLQSDAPVVVNAKNAHGQTVSLNAVRSAKTYSLVDESRSMFDPTTGTGVIETHDANNTPKIRPTDANLVQWTGLTLPSKFSKDGAVDAHWAAGQVFDWYFTRFGRNSIDGNGMSIVSVANATDPGFTPMANAFWDGKKMVYGNPGDGLYPLSAALDVDAHEMTHGVTQFSVDPTLSLIYMNQSGAVNEATSDYFGNAVQSDVEGITPSDPTWAQLGEDVCKKANNEFGFPCPLRDMGTPRNEGNPETTAEYVGLLPEFDNGGVHIDSTIYSSALWDLRTALYNAHGGQAGATLADQMVYGAYQYYTPTTDFEDGRHAVVQAATDLETQAIATAADVAAVNQAFDDHGITDGWDEDPARIDSQVLVENDIPTFMFGVFGPEASGTQFVYVDDADKLPDNGPTQVYAGPVDGSTPPVEIGDPTATTRDEGMPTISGDQTAWVHVLKGKSLTSTIEGRVLGGPLQTLASQSKSLLVEPALAGDRLAWTRVQFPGGFGIQNVYTRTLGGTVVKLSKSDGGGTPATNGTWVAWNDYDTKFRPVIKAENMQTGRVYTLAAKAFTTWGAPALNNTSLVVFQDLDGDGKGAIVRWKLGTKPTNLIKVVPATSSLAPMWLGYVGVPAVSVNAAYVTFSSEEPLLGWNFGENPSADLHDAGRHVYVAPLTAGSEPLLVSHNGGDQAYPVMAGDAQQVLWLDGSQGKDDIITRTTPAG